MTCSRRSSRLQSTPKHFKAQHLQLEITKRLCVLEIHYASDPSGRGLATHRGSDRIQSQEPFPSDAVGNHMRCSLFTPPGQLFAAPMYSYLEMGQSLATRGPHPSVCCLLSARDGSIHVTPAYFPPGGP